MFDVAALRAYCASVSSNTDLGCGYGRGDGSPHETPPEAACSHRDPRVVALVLLDPAAGPGYSASTLRDVRVPALVIGSVQNDFLPFEHHAGRYASLLGNAELLALDAGEGHFVYLNSCSSDLAANGVPLCTDRAGVNRDEVHAWLAPRILDFLLTTTRDRAR